MTLLGQDRRIFFSHWSLGGSLKIALVVWVCLKMSGCILMIQGPWGPRIGGRLPNGSQIYFQARPVGRETYDRLTWIRPDGSEEHFIVDEIHAGFDHVTIRYMNGGDLVWVESDGEIGASIDLRTTDFRAEFDMQHDWAKYDTGEVLDSGFTGSVWWVVGPW
jgi:hypothetical protein